MIILLCSVRVFKRNINIKCKPFKITCMTNAITWRAYVCDLGLLLLGCLLLGGCVCLWYCINDSILTKMKVAEILMCVRTHGTRGGVGHLHAISPYFLVNQLLVHITVQRVGITYRVQCVSPEELLRLYSRIHVLSIK